MIARERMRGRRDERGGFEHHRVAEGECRGDLPCGNGDGKVPGRDDPHHADGLARNLHVDARAHRIHAGTGDAHGLAREELEDVSGPLDLGDALRPHLPLLAGQERAERLLAGQNRVADEIEDLGAAVNAARPPRGRRVACRLDRVAGLRGIGRGEVPDTVAGVGRIEIRDRGAALHPQHPADVAPVHAVSPLHQVSLANPLNCGPTPLDESR